jgi:hypothetical protein
LEIKLPGLEIKLEGLEIKLEGSPKFNPYRKGIHIVVASNYGRQLYECLNILFKKYVVYSQPNALAPSTAASLPLSVDTRSLALPL